MKKNTITMALYSAARGHYVSMTATQLMELNRNSKNRLVGDETNKTTSQKHIDNLARDMKDWKGMFPVITVNTVTFNIVDGQNRREAFIKAIKKGWIDANETFDVKFITIPEEKEIELIIKMNSQQKVWVADDLVHSYLSDRRDYQRLVGFCHEHPYFLQNNGIPRYRSASALINGKINGKCLKDGTFTCTDKECNEAEDALLEVMELVEIFNYKNAAPSAWFENLASSYVSIKKEILVPNGIPFRTFVKGVKKNLNKRIVYKNKKEFDATMRPIAEALVAGMRYAS